MPGRDKVTVFISSLRKGGGKSDNEMVRGRESSVHNGKSSFLFVLTAGGNHSPYTLLFCRFHTNKKLAHTLRHTQQTDQTTRFSAPQLGMEKQHRCTAH